MKSSRREFRNVLKTIVDYKPEFVHVESDQGFACQQNSASPLVVAVTGGKGGVGKTLTTANLGMALSNQGMRTLLIDGDFGLANLDVLFGVYPKSNIEDVLLGRCRMENVIMAVQNNLYLLPCASGIATVENLNALQKKTISDSLESLSRNFDVILVDTAAGVSQNVKHWVSSSAESIVVASPEPTSLADAYATMKVLCLSKCENKFQLVVNMAQSEEEAHYIFQKIALLADENFGASVEFMGWIPLAGEVRHSVRSRVPFVQQSPFGQASASVRLLASKVAKWQREPLRQKGSLQLFWQHFTFQQSEPQFQQGDKGFQRRVAQNESI